ncbi:16S rRNA (uracil1498-N3)-methyltransferase [Melghirimyces profundicolus]|uniref:Ribosomal RNA small subunit methyltransferase E n=1 Tax=Melghirimyces profundicolus TaxID=1242148 RepID=A0A2T6C961_9BACL|nr:16S rRNA (uracil(1498)-N(3))-methyltransferase [Melghirimyces profundicolus]PTX64849.1 16S rRNA (uracil1498-N3)-methyltransferase [Melghirimyces profundicolus]
MQRYFVDSDAIGPDRVTIRGDDVHHIKNVLRMSPEDRLICCDGQGRDYLTEVESIGTDEVRCRIIDSSPSPGEPGVRVSVASSLPKGDKLEWVLQKGTELGADSFLPFTSARTVVKLDGKRAAKKQIRWQRIVKEAAEQSHRGRIPPVELPGNWRGLLEKFPSYDRVLFAYEKEGQSLADALKGAVGRRFLVVIGPEGGFTEAEAMEAASAGAVPVHLGPRILRAETAPLAILSCIFYSYGEMGGEPL